MSDELLTGRKSGKSVPPRGFYAAYLEYLATSDPADENVDDDKYWQERRELEAARDETLRGRR